MLLKISRTRKYLLFYFLCRFVEFTRSFLGWFRFWWRFLSASFQDWNAPNEGCQVGQQRVSFWNQDLYQWNTNPPRGLYHVMAQDLHCIRSSPRSNKICSLSLISLPSVKQGWKFEETSTGRSMKYTPTAVYLIHTDVQLMYKAIHCLWDAMKGKRTQHRQYVKIQPHGQKWGQSWGLTPAQDRSWDKRWLSIVCFASRSTSFAERTNQQLIMLEIIRSWATLLQESA